MYYFFLEFFNTVTAKQTWRNMTDIVVERKDAATQV
jgi:hypothetical protein